MTQPIIDRIETFDATEGYALHFLYLGERKPEENEVSIREAVRNSTSIYDETNAVTTGDHTIPPKSLQNGKSYWVKVRVTVGGEKSPWSEEVKVLTLARPIINFTSIDSAGYVYNDDLMMTAVYQQSNGEVMETYQFALTDIRKQTVEAFPVRAPDGSTPNYATERMSLLKKGVTYWLKLSITTHSGASYEYWKKFIPMYIVPTFDGVLSAKSMDDQGQTLVQSYLKQILGTQVKPYVPNSENDNDDNYTYLDGDKVMVPENGPLIFTNLGMSTASDLVINVWCQNIKNGVFLDIAPKKGEGIHLKLYKYDDKVVAEKEYAGLTSRHWSNIIPNLLDSPFYLSIKVVEFRIAISIKKVGE